MPAHAISFDLVSYSRRLSNNFVVRCAFPSDSANIEDSHAIEFDTNSKNLQSRIADNCEEIVCFRPHFAHAHRMRFRSSARGLKQFDREWTVTTSIILPHENAYDVKNFLTSIAGHDNFNEETEHGLEILAHDDKLIARYEYDNTAQNAANPDPSLTITWGEQSHEEMLFTAVSYRWKDETSTDTREQYERMLDAGRMFGMMDDNIDDVLQKAELKGRAGQRLANNFERLDVNGDGGLSKQEYAAVFAARRQGD